MHNSLSSLKKNDESIWVRNPKKSKLSKSKRSKHGGTSSTLIMSKDATVTSSELVSPALPKGTELCDLLTTERTADNKVNDQQRMTNFSIASEV